MNPLPDAVTAWNVLLTLGVLVAIGANLASVLRARAVQQRAIQQPLEIRPVRDLVTREDFSMTHKQLTQRLDAHEQHIAVIRDELRHAGEQSEKSASNRSAGIYTKIDSLRLELSEKLEAVRVEGKRDTEQVHERINAVLSAVSELRGELKHR